MIIEHKKIIGKSGFTFELGDRSYTVFFNTFSQIKGFGQCILKDNKTKRQYIVDSRLEINGHTFMPYWGYTYNYNRHNYVGDTENFKLLVDC